MNTRGLDQGISQWGVSGHQEGRSPEDSDWREIMM